MLAVGFELHGRDGEHGRRVAHRRDVAADVVGQQLIIITAEADVLAHCEAAADLPGDAAGAGFGFGGPPRLVDLHHDQVAAPAQRALVGVLRCEGRIPVGHDHVLDPRPVHLADRTHTAA
jgi:hypothetical protein